MAIVLSSNPIYAALFGAGYTNLTTPRIESFRPAMMQVGLSSHWGKSDALNFDMNFNYSITSQFSMGATLITQKSLVLHTQAAMVSIPKLFNFRIGAGLLNIATDPNLGSWDYQVGENRYNFTEYMGAAIELWGVTLTGGVMKRRAWQSTTNVAINIPSSFFGAIEINTPYGSFLMDTDHDTQSVGYRFNPDSTTSIALMSTTPINPYSPVMGVGSSTGIYLRKEFSIFQELHNEFESVKESINDYKQVKAQFEQQIAQFKSDLETLQSTKEGISTALNKLVKTYQPFEGNSQSTEEVYVNGAASFDFFQRAQSFYNQGAYYNAIQELKNGQRTSPFLPIFPIQIGSIYYLLGDLTNAIRYWKEGYMLNPQHPELQKLPKVILEDIRARSRAKKGE